MIPLRTQRRSGDRASGGLPLWWRAIRPRTLTLALAPVLLGTALAVHQGATADLSVLLVVLLCALAIQAGTNLYNDAADYLRGNDGPARLGPLRITAAGLATPLQVMQAARVCLGMALAGGVWLVVLGGWPVLLVGLASMAAARAYSCGARPISHGPFGEAFVLVFFGVLAVAGSHALQTGRWDALALGLGLLPGAQAAAVLLVNNVRDAEVDRAAGRRTLVAVLGATRARHLYAVLMLAPFATLPLLIGAGLMPLGLLLGLLPLPPCIRLVRRFQTQPAGAAMNRTLARTAQWQLGFATSLSLALLLS